MGNENGVWIMYGPSFDDPECIRSVDGAVDYINKVGFLPLFKNGIQGFSLEEHTAPECWWCEDPETDPWIWRTLIARGGEVAYGKFFEKKAGFISREWLPYFANYRRDGYDFDALWDDEKAPARQKKIMDLFSDELGISEYYSFEIKKKAGFGKGGEKGFDGVLAALQMETYLCISDFRQRRNKSGEGYGWQVAVYSTPELIFGRELVTSAYCEAPEKSRDRIVARIKEVFGEDGSAAAKFR